jgi:hypothetical protein
LEDKSEYDPIQEHSIKSQRIGKMFDDILSDDKNVKISLKTRLLWRWLDIKSLFCNLKYTVCNHIKWHKTMKSLRPWEGFDGMLDVMLTHLRDYVSYEEKYGHSAEEYKNKKIEAAKELITLLVRMKAPDEYLPRRQDEIGLKYGRYYHLITEYENGSTGYSGDFVAQGDGWAGIESGTHPRDGYFEFVDNKFELTASPDQNETDKLLAEIRQYYEDTRTTYEQAQADSDKDFDKLGYLLKENLYLWWD